MEIYLFFRLFVISIRLNHLIFKHFVENKIVLFSRQPNINHFLNWNVGVHIDHESGHVSFPYWGATLDYYSIDVDLVKFFCLERDNVELPGIKFKAIVVIRAITADTCKVCTADFMAQLPIYIRLPLSVFQVNTYKRSYVEIIGVD